MAVGRQGTAAVMEVVMPSGGVGNLADAEGTAVDRLRCLHVAGTTFVADIGSKTNGISGYQNSAGATTLIDEKGSYGF